MADTQKVKVTSQDIESVDAKLYQFAKGLPPGEQNVMLWLLDRASRAPAEKEDAFKEIHTEAAGARPPAPAQVARAAQLNRALGISQFQRLRPGVAAAGSSIGVTGTVMF